MNPNFKKTEDDASVDIEKLMVLFVFVDTFFLFQVGSDLVGLG